MIIAEVQWLQRNDLTRLDYDARYAAELPNLIGLVFGKQDYELHLQTVKYFEFLKSEEN